MTRRCQHLALGWESQRVTLLADWEEDRVGPGMMIPVVARRARGDFHPMRERGATT